LGGLKWFVEWQGKVAVRLVALNGVGLAGRMESRADTNVDGSDTAWSGADGNFWY